VKKLITASLLLLTLISCSSAVQPMSTSAPTFEALLSATPTETLQAFSSATPTFEAAATAMPDSGDVLDPQGSPVQEWRGIPIMPEAITGQEFTPDNAYSFRVNTSAEEVQDFYTETLSELGWSQPFETSFNANGGMINFRKEGSSLTITVTPLEDSVVVLLVMALA
jgi:hypothetical protein